MGAAVKGSRIVHFRSRGMRASSADFPLDDDDGAAVGAAEAGGLIDSTGAGARGDRAREESAGAALALADGAAEAGSTGAAEAGRTGDVTSGATFATGVVAVALEPVLPSGSGACCDQR